MSGKTLRLLTVLSTILAVIAWAAVLFSETTSVIPKGLFGFQAGASLLQWLNAFALFLTFIAILASVLYNTEAAKELRVEVSAAQAILSRIEPQVDISRGNSQSLLEIKPLVQEMHHLVRQKAEVRTIKPHDPIEFEVVFGDAQNIRAYNPPLTLLTREHDKRFRNVIFNVLSKEDRAYRAIVGREGGEQLVNLHRRWVDERKDKDTLQVISKMHVTAYMHPEQLHSELWEWPGFNSTDLRGLSYFLIETPKCRKLLLYILGRPFVETFRVPDIGLLITEPVNEATIYNEVLDVFDKRWDILGGGNGDPNILADETLPSFCDAYSARLESVRPITEVKSA